MNKRLALIIIVITLPTVISGCVNVRGDDYRFNGFSFDYIDASGWIQDMALVLIIDCDYPEGIPSYFWQFSEKYTHETIYLFGPENLSYFGNIESGRFIIDLEPPPGGEYIFTVYNDTTDSILYSMVFEMEYDFEIDIESVKWAIDAHTFEPSYKNHIKKDTISQLDGIQLMFNLSNTGDIPFKIGDPYTVNIPIYLKINVFKKGIEQPLFSSEPQELKRIDTTQEYNEQWFFKPGEMFECSESVIDNSIKHSKLKSGKYFIDGYVQLANTSTVTFEPIYFRTDYELEIGEDALPSGFELVMIVVSITVIILLKRKISG
jgi:hypothetical protein